MPFPAGKKFPEFLDIKKKSQFWICAAFRFAGLGLVWFPGSAPPVVISPFPDPLYSHLPWHRGTLDLALAALSGYPGDWL
jgi:hypothetical protein